MASVSTSQCELICFSGENFADLLKPRLSNGANRGHQLGDNDLELLSVLAGHLFGLVV